MGVRNVDRDGGQAVVSAGATLFVLMVVLLLALADVGGHAIERTRARTAADAAALAGLEGGRVAAARLAAAHGASIVSWHEAGSVVEVEVQVGDAIAAARATDAAG
jgi:hypothetical protein